MPTLLITDVPTMFLLVELFCKQNNFSSEPLIIYIVEAEEITINLYEKYVTNTTIDEK